MEQVSSPNILRLIYQGRFLHGNVTLGGEKIQWKKACVLIDARTHRSSVALETSLLSSSFFLSRRTEVPQYSGQACFDTGREERGNSEKEEKGRKRLVRKIEGKTGFGVRPQERQKRDRREGGGGGVGTQLTSKSLVTFYKGISFLTTHPISAIPLIITLFLV